jgi:hypothetical protein
MGEVGTGPLESLVAAFGLPTCAEVSDILTGWSSPEWPKSPEAIVQMVLEGTLTLDTEPDEVAHLWGVLPTLPLWAGGLIRLWRVKEQLLLEVTKSSNLQELLRRVNASLEWFLPSVNIKKFLVRPLEKLLDAYGMFFGDDWVSRVGGEVDLFKLINAKGSSEMICDIRALGKARAPVRLETMQWDGPYYPAVDKALKREFGFATEGCFRGGGL